MIAITDRKLCHGPLVERVRMLAEAGTERIILREKDLSEEELLPLAKACMDVCQDCATELVVNSAVGVARRIGCGSVHMPMPLLRTTDVSGFTLVGASVHSPDEALEAQELGADYLIAGHVFPTACKIGEPRGTTFLRDVVSVSDVPVYAVGGVNPDNVYKVRDAGCRGACTMSLAMRSENLPELVRSMTFRFPPPYARSDRRWGHL